MPAHWFGVLTALISGGAQFVLFLRWLYRRMRDDEIVRAFVRDIAVTHMPHIYATLREIAARQGIDPPETPLIRFVEFNGRRRAS